MKPKKLIILDRDGCLNQLPTEKKYIEKSIEFILYDDLHYLFKFVSDNKLLMAIATNQQGISLGLIDHEELKKMHTKLWELGKTYGLLNFEIFVCPHMANSCACRKPSPGLLIQAMHFYNVTQSETIFIGDSESDELAAKNAEIDFIFMNRNNSKKTNESWKISTFSELKETDVFHDYL